MPPSDPLPDFPTSDEREPGYQAAKTTLGAADLIIPGLGYGLQQLVEGLIGSPLQKRRAEWFNELGRAIIRLQGRVEAFGPAALAANEEFVSTVYQATESAMRTHREEKRDALRNAVLNTAAGYLLDDVVRGAFMDYIDRFSALHLRVLRLLADPNQSPQMVQSAKNTYMGSQYQTLRAALPRSEADDASLDRVLDDLSRERLIDGSIKAISSAESLLSSRTTEIGTAFLRFISEPRGD